MSGVDDWDDRLVAHPSGNNISRAMDPPVLLDPPKQYDAFISYAHSDTGELGPALQEGLQRLAKPWNRRRALEVFRDKTGLAVSPALWPSIYAAMDGSRWFVLLASPKSAKSEGVGKEIRRWVATKGAESILAVLIDGTWVWDDNTNDFNRGASNAVHEELYGVFDKEPLHLDLTWAKDEKHLTLRDMHFRDQVATLAASIHGITKDELDGADIREQQRTQRLKRGAISSLCVMLVLAIAAGLIAFREYRNAVRQRDRAIFSQVVTQANSLRDSDPSLASQLDLVAYRMRPTSDLRTRLLTAGNLPLSTLLTGHTGLVNSVIFSPDGRTMASAGLDKNIRLWNVSNTDRPGLLGQPLTGHEGEIYSVAFRPDGQILASGSADGTIRLWNLVHPAHPTLLSKTPVNQKTLISSVTFSPDGHTLATADILNESIYLWNVTDPTRPVLLDQRLSAKDTRFMSVAFSPDGHTIAGGSTDAMLRLWDVTDLAHPMSLGEPLKGHRNMVNTLAFSPDGHTLASGSYDLTVRLWNVTDPTRSVPLGEPITAHTSNIGAVAFSRNGHLLATSSVDETTRLWNVIDPAHPAPVGPPLLGHTAAVVSVAFGADDRVLATSSEDGTVRLWSISSTVLTAHTGPVYSGVFTPDGNILVTSSADNTVRLWNMKDPLRPVLLGALPPAFAVDVRSMALSPDGRTLATGFGSFIVLWNVSNPANPTAPPGAVLEGYFSSPGRVSSIAGIAFSPDSRTLASAGVDNTVRLWNVADPAHPVPLGQLATIHRQPVSSVAFSPDGRTLASGSYDSNVRLWNVADPSRPVFLTEIGGQRSFIYAIAFSPDGRTLASGNADKTIFLWNVTDPAHPAQSGQPLTGHTKGVFSVVFSPDGHTLASGSIDQTIRLWNVTDPAHVAPLGQPLSGHTHTVFWLAFHPHIDILASGSLDRSVRIWAMDVDTAIHRLCATTRNVLTRERWNQYVSELPYDPPCGIS